MSRLALLVLLLLAVFLQGGAYGLTFQLPRLFSTFGANEKAVGAMLAVTAVSTLVTVYFSGHLTDRFGRVATLGLACLSIAAAMVLYGMSTSIGALLVSASILKGGGWGLTYTLVPVVLTRLARPNEMVLFFAINSACLMAGFGLSPVMAVLIENAGGTVASSFFVMAAVCVIAAAIFFSLIHPVQEHAVNQVPEAKSQLTLSRISEVLRSRALLSIIMVCIGASIFASKKNFQTVIADERGLIYAEYFLIYTATVVTFRILLAKFSGGSNPYLTIAGLQYLMAGSLLLFVFSGNSASLYWLVAIGFGIGYGVSYPILAAMAARDADSSLEPQTLKVFALSYFIGVFVFPLAAGWVIVEIGTTALLALLFGLAAAEATMAAVRGRRERLERRVAKYG